jgi:hypothetical protein
MSVSKHRLHLYIKHQARNKWLPKLLKLFGFPTFRLRPYPMRINLETTCALNLISTFSLLSLETKDLKQYCQNRLRSPMSEGGEHWV